MKTEFLTQHCNNILEMRAICTLPPRIIERLNLSSIKRWKNDIFSNEILLFLLGPACAEGLSIPLTVTSISLPGSSFCCLLHSLSILSRIFLQLQGHLHLADLPSGWSGCKHRPQAVPYFSKATLHVGRTAMSNPQVYLALSFTCIKLKKLHRSDLQQQLLYDSRIFYTPLQNVHYD